MEELCGYARIQNMILVSFLSYLKRLHRFPGSLILDVRSPCSIGIIIKTLIPSSSEICWIPRTICTEILPFWYLIIWSKSYSCFLTWEPGIDIDEFISPVPQVRTKLISLSLSVSGLLMVVHNPPCRYLMTHKYSWSSMKPRTVQTWTPREKGGIVWHTQWSGKSLTMSFVIRAIKRDEALIP